MEEETRFLSGGCTRLPTILAHLLHDLNTYRKATLVGKYFIEIPILRLFNSCNLKDWH